MRNSIMKYLISILIFECIYFSGYSQIEFTKIHVSNDIELIQISENAYIHVTTGTLPNFGRFSSNGLLYIENNEAFLFDSPITDSLTKCLIDWIQDTLHVKIVGFVPNHWHNDCMGGLQYINSQNIDSYANQITIDIAKSKNLPIPKHGFTDSLHIQLGNKTISCYYFGAAHSIDNIIVWIPSEQILFAGCMLKSMDSMNLGNYKDGDISAYPKTLDKVSTYFPQAKIVIPGHGQFGNRELITHTRSLIPNK